jgi:hypothetical protein
VHVGARLGQQDVGGLDAQVVEFFHLSSPPKNFAYILFS